MYKGLSVSSLIDNSHSEFVLNGFLVASSFIVLLNGWYQWRSTTLPLNFLHSSDVHSLSECPTSIAEAPFASQNRKLGSNRPQRLCMRAWLGSHWLSPLFNYSEEGLNRLSSKPTIGLNHIQVNRTLVSFIIFLMLAFYKSKSHSRSKVSDFHNFLHL